MRPFVLLLAAILAYLPTSSRADDFFQYETDQVIAEPAPASSTTPGTSTDPLSSDTGYFDLFWQASADQNCQLHATLTQSAVPPADATIMNYYFIQPPRDDINYDHKGGWIALSHAGTEAQIFAESCDASGWCTATFPSSINPWNNPWGGTSASGTWSARERASIRCGVGYGTWTVRVVYQYTRPPPPECTISFSGATAEKSGRAFIINFGTNVPATTEVDYSLNGSSWTVYGVDPLSLTGHGWLVQGLQPMTLYYFRIMAHCNNGLSTNYIGSIKTKGEWIPLIIGHLLSD